MTSPSEKVTPLRKPIECPNCGKPSHRDSYPFCSTRCADVDLNRWFSGGYAIASDVKPDGDEGDFEQ